MAILRALEATTDPDRERPHQGSDIDSDSGSEDESPHDHHHPSSSSLSPKMSRIVQDNEVRQKLNIGGAFTGPKGVLADYRFHQRQERAREEQSRVKMEAAAGGLAMSSGWVARQIAEEEAAKRGEQNKTSGEAYAELLERLENEEEDEYMKEYRAKRLAEMQRLAAKPKFGVVRELEVDDYVSAVDDEDPQVLVLVHLYKSQIEACRLVNTFLDALAKKYLSMKFLRIVSAKADPNFDDIALPALLAYKGGYVVTSVMPVTHEVEGWEETGRCDLEDFERVLLEHGALNEQDAVTSTFSGLSLA
ncbi:hypothetical protein HK104_007630 [Borealophlyctis nickersoniae]|nr:hypothetical protein HK104_007630 [Borealophlyctis nickersoniae]